MSKRGIPNKKLREEEQQAIGAIYKKYIDTFQQDFDIPRKTFVKSNTLYAEEENSNEKGQLYNPEPIIKFNKKETRSTSVPTTSWNTKQRRTTKKKSNLKSLGDELKMLQHQRQSREPKPIIIDPSPSPAPNNTENDYSNSTNLFISNLSPNVTENHLIELFGVYGPLASVKIMWPRNEPNKNSNCGFVAFMSRVDAERALNGLRHHQEMRINWGKSVKIPSHPVHIPSELYKLYSPPPPSGLPFNAQILKKDVTDPNDNILTNATIRVTIPFDRNLLMIIHRTIEFVIREGPEFEALIVNIESGNSDFNFLTDFQSPAHTYYRWKLYSILHGDPKNCWPMKPFRMYENGSIWIPPTAPNYKEGMPKELIVKNEQNSGLSDAQAAKLVVLIKNLTTHRKSIAEVMTFCLNHAVDAALDIVVDSFRNPETNPLKKIARLYLLSDVLYNCKIKKISLTKFNNPDVCYGIFKHVHDTYKSMNYSQDKECLKIKVLMVLRAWVFYDFYDVGFITKLENIFLHGNEMGCDDDDNYSDEPLDGNNLLKRSLSTVSSDCFIVDKSYVNDDIFN